MKCFPQPCASTIQIVRPSRFRAETQPKLKPASWGLSETLSQSFTERLLLIVQNGLRCGQVAYGTIKTSFSEEGSCKGARSSAVIRVYDAAGNLIEAHEHKGDFKSGERRRVKQKPS